MAQTSPKKLVKISELARMAGVSTPTIKYYMAEGLLPQPAMRTSRNMAYYEPALADRIRAIKALQSTHFFPLRVIAELLEPAPSSRLRTLIAADTRQRLGLMVPGLEAVVAAGKRGLTRAEVLERLRITTGVLDQLEEMGLVSPRRAGESKAPVYSGTDLDLLEVIDETRRKGLAHLFPMEILPRYVDSLRRLVQDEIELFRQLVLDAGLGDDTSIAEVTREATRLGGRLILAMRSRMILAELQDLLAQEKS
jgi:DNA-binding transcriptional MerR regulator